MFNSKLRLFLAASSIWLFVAGNTVAASPDTGFSETQLLERARNVNGDLYSDLKSFVCHEEIRRFKAKLDGQKRKPIDTVSASLSFENGVERYSDIRQNAQVREAMWQIAGAWSEGEYGTLLQQTQRLIGTQNVSFVEFSEVNGAPAALYRFPVSEKESPWDLSVGKNHYSIPFETAVWISVESGKVIKISRKSMAIPAETRISQITWEVTLSRVDLGGNTWLLPIQAAYAVDYKESNHREWNQMSFTDYHHYGAESVLKFN